MGGWKLWTALGAAVIYAVVGFMLNMHDADKMIEIIIGSMAALGFGHKLDRASAAAVVEALPAVQAVKVVSAPPVQVVKVVSEPPA